MSEFARVAGDVDYRLELIQSSERIRERQASLLHNVFPNAHQYTVEYLRWEYDENPFGGVVGFDAYSGDELCAHYATQPLEAILFGKPSRGLLSFNTATDPAHQGRGLFTRLARETYRYAAEAGYEFVIGVANANSTPGFITKLGFQLVCPLDVRVGIGNPASLHMTNCDFQRVWSVTTRRWRLQNPKASYKQRGGRVSCDAGIPFLEVALTDRGWAPDLPVSRSRLRPATLWIGLPSERWYGVSIPLPRALRPSPLNFIFLDLTGNARQLDPTRVVFSAIDFDAY